MYHLWGGGKVQDVGGGSGMKDDKLPYSISPPDPLDLGWEPKTERNGLLKSL